MMNYRGAASDAGFEGDLGGPDQRRDTMEYKLDMDMMLAMHDALRRQMVPALRGRVARCGLWP